MLCECLFLRRQKVQHTQMRPFFKPGLVQQGNIVLIAYPKVYVQLLLHTRTTKDTPEYEVSLTRGDAGNLALTDFSW